MNKKLLILLAVLVTFCLAAGLSLRFYLVNHLFISPMSDQDLLEILFVTDFPGYSEFKVISSEGKGPRRIPRQMQIAVTIEAYPEPIVCGGEVFYDMGDPMALNVQWHTVECVGQMVLMERARSTMSSGLDLDNCHSEIINDLLAYWIREEIITPKEILSPELREIILALAADEAYLRSIQPLDAGLFDTADAVLHQVVGEGETSEPAYVLRCDGSVDVYLVKYWNNVYNTTKRNAGDIFLPDTLTRKEVLEIKELEGKATPQKGVEVEVTVIPKENCQGWTCDIKGTLFYRSLELEKRIRDREVSLSQFSYCSPTAGQQITNTGPDGEFSFEIFLHDTDILTFEVVADGYKPLEYVVKGMDCLYCSCSPLDLVLESD